MMITNLIKYSRPGNLILGIMMYAFGVGMVDYLGKPIDWGTYWIGQGCVIFLLLSSSILKVYYNPVEPSQQVEKNAERDQDGHIFTTPAGKRTLLLFSLTSLTIGAALSVLLLINGGFSLIVLLVLGVAFVLAFFYSVPPLRLVNSGYGEIIDAFLHVNLIPALAMLFQTNDMHRLLPMLTFPLTSLYLSMALSLSLKDYSHYIRSGINNLMTRLTWRNGMNLHNILILCSYLILVMALLLGLPWSLGWPGLLTFPIGIYQIWQMRQIANGVKPNWKVLDFTAVTLLSLTAYLLTITLWIG
ncbi:MAG: prenyltransferase [Anaerolineaceae bacterium]|nr:prenyltransferase [Anaerolineaceae bacterium]